MDPLTHTLVGVTLAKAGLERRHGRGTTWLLAAASNMPDLDVLVAFAGASDSFLLRRTFTHSLMGLPLLALVLAAVFRRWKRDTPFTTLFALALLGGGVHVFFDLVNSYGVVPLWPFSDARPELAWVFIIDLAVWGILLAPHVLVRTPLGRLGRDVIFLTSALVLAGYVAACGVGRWRAVTLLDRTVAEAGVTPDFRYVFPEALGPHRWRGVVREGDTYAVHLVNVLSERITPVETVVTEARRPEIALLRTSRRARRLEWFFKAPVWRLGEDGTVAEVYDLRFRSAVLSRRGEPFLMRLPLAEARGR